MAYETDDGLAFYIQCCAVKSGSAGDIIDIVSAADLKACLHECAQTDGCYR